MWGPGSRPAQASLAIGPWEVPWPLQEAPNIVIHSLLKYYQGLIRGPVGTTLRS